jgi:tRNA pseudouridine13 synthase
MLEYNIDLNLPYITADLPGMGGILRATPEDFVVEEVPLYEAQGEGQHLYVNLTKVGLTTREVQNGLERIFGLKKGDVSFAGMKDKHARTTQMFSLSVGHKPSDFAESAAKLIEVELPVTVNWVRFHANKLRLGHLLGNRFRVRVSGLELPVVDALRRAEIIRSRILEHGVPNYFGSQRLGENGGNVRQGQAIVRGDRDRRNRSDKWLQRFLISAYQSYLCNRYLARRVDRGYFHRLLDGDVAKKYATGGMFDVIDVGAEQPRYAAQEIGFTAPLYGPKMWVAKAESGEFEGRLLEEEQITLADFGRARVEGTRRMGRLLANDLVLESDSAGVTASFMLRKGAFATTIMRELMKVDVQLLAAVEDDIDE